MPVATSSLIRRSSSVNSYTPYYSYSSTSDRNLSKYSYKNTNLYDTSYLTSSKSYTRYAKPPLSGTYSLRESRTSDIRYSSTNYSKSLPLTTSNSLISKYSTDDLPNYRDRLKESATNCYNLTNNYKNDSSELSSLLRRASLTTDYNRKDSVSNLENETEINKCSRIRSQTSLSCPKSLDFNSSDAVCSTRLSSSRPWRSRLSSLQSNDNYSRSSSGYSSVSKSSESENGPCGLQNIGNTCFMNSILQCLAHTKPLLDYCLKDNYSMDINTTQSSMKGTLIREFSNLLQLMWKNTANAVNPHSFKTQVQRFAPRFMGYSQQDAQEFLRYILQGLHDDVNHITATNRKSSLDLDDHLTENQKASESWRKYLKTDNSKIVDIFVGQLKSTLKCCYCGHTSVTFDPFWDLSIPISKSYSSVRLSECLNLFTNEENLIGDEMPVCGKCKVKRKSTKSFSIQKFPQILVLHLKRFTQGDSYRVKLSTKVDFPLNLDLSSYSTNACSDRWKTYNLYAVSNHSGSTSSGHYTAYCKHPYTGQWQEYNDSRVSKNLKINDIVTPEAYILFYEISGRSSRL